MTRAEKGPVVILAFLICMCICILSCAVTKYPEQEATNEQHGADELLGSDSSSSRTYVFISGDSDLVNQIDKDELSALFGEAQTKEGYLLSAVNHGKCQELERHGDNLAVERIIDHWAYFPNGASRANFIQRAKQLRFSVIHLLPPYDEFHQYGVRISRRDAPTLENMMAITTELSRIAGECGGEYDTWDTQVVESKEDTF